MLPVGILSYEVLIKVALGCPRILKLLQLLSSRGGEKAIQTDEQLFEIFLPGFQIQSKNLLDLQIGQLHAVDCELIHFLGLDFGLWMF